LDTGALARACEVLREPLTEQQVNAFQRYAAELVAWNERLNLTRITDPHGIAVRHIADSLVCLRGLPEKAGEQADLRCVDVGSGAGLPGIPLAVVCPAWSMTLIEATEKKARFLRHVVDALELGNTSIESERVESLAHERMHRQACDVAVARAVAHTAVLAEYMLPLIAVGGRMLALKGKEAIEEAEASVHAIELMGGRLTEIIPYELPGAPGVRHLVVVDKVGSSPGKYPLRPGLPRRRPL
jgi:16S rRNA (guanine527-N7)-methyltransferase